MAESYVEEVVPNLYNSQFCRLCGDENSNGYPLYSAEIDDEDFSTKINMFLPIRISDDGKYPRWICPGCHLQVEGTAEFFNRVLIGQEKLRQILNNENEIVDKLELNQIDLNTTLNKQQNENDADRINNTSILAEKFEMGEHFFPDEHTLVRSITPIKRKRGRPKKEKKLEIINKEIIEKIDELKTEFDPLMSENTKDEQYDDSSGRRKRQIKVPQRYEGTVQGKELEKVYADLGVAERGSYKNSVNDCVFVQYKDENGDIREELIGHVQDDSGANLGDLFLINLKVDDKFYKDNLTTKKTQFVCDICKVCFWKETKFLQHRLSHKNVRFECTQCLRNFKERSELIEHQDKEDHQGEGIIEGFEPLVDENSPQDDAVLPIVETTKPQDDVNTLLEQIESTNLDLINNELNEDINKSSSNQLNFINEQNVNNNEINETNVNTLIEQPEQNLILSLIESTEQQQNENIENIQTENLIKIPINNNETSTTTTTKTGKYVCDQCNKVFSRLNSFITHKRIDHGTNRQFVCSKCDKRFKSKTLLQRHHIAHSDNRPFKCETCGAEFKTKISLTAHETCHTGNKKYVCETCNHSFVHKHSLKLHLDIHLGTKPHKCPVCNKGFSQLGNMQEHHRIHTGERPFDCKICGKSFKTSSQCRMHVTRHEVHRPMKCNMCHKSFINNEELKVHLRRHTNEKPYSCKVCSKNFIDIPSIKKHMRLHTGEKPYSCTKCARRFADRSNLTKHKKLHESKELMANLMKIEQDLDENTQEILPDITSNSIPMSQSLILSDITQNPATSTVWSIIDDNNSVPVDPPPSNSIDLPLSTIESKQDNVASNQIVYVTYQDPNNPVGNKTTLYVVQ